jgi:hypothetical protein
MEAMASLALTIHLLWILWVITGAFWTRGRVLLAAFHILSLFWGIVERGMPLRSLGSALEILKSE